MGSLLDAKLCRLCATDADRLAEISTQNLDVSKDLLKNYHEDEVYESHDTEARSTKTPLAWILQHYLGLKASDLETVMPRFICLPCLGNVSRLVDIVSGITSGQIKLQRLLDGDQRANDNASAGLKLPLIIDPGRSDKLTKSGCVDGEGGERRRRQVMPPKYLMNGEYVVERNENSVAKKGRRNSSFNAADVDNGKQNKGKSKRRKNSEKTDENTLILLAEEDSLGFNQFTLQSIEDQKQASIVDGSANLGLVKKTADLDAKDESRADLGPDEKDTQMKDGQNRYDKLFELNDLRDGGDTLSADKQFKKKTVRDRFPCENCDKEFRSYTSYHYHRSSAHSSQKYNCTFPGCDKTYSVRNLLTRHLRTHGSSRPFICQTCNRGFKSQSNLSTHQAKHDSEPKYSCEKCGQMFKFQTSLNKHMKRHDSAKEFQCNICARLFFQKVNLQEHIRVHTKEKPFECSECSRRFSTSSQLREHVKRHTGEKPHACPHCEMRFLRSDGLLNHLRKHTNERPFACRTCNKRFKNSWALNKHTRSQHSLNRPNHVCKDCGQGYSDASNLARHRKVKHSDKQDLDVSAVPQANSAVWNIIRDVGNKLLDEAEDNEEEFHKVIYVTYDGDGTDITGEGDLHPSNDDLSAAGAIKADLAESVLLISDQSKPVVSENPSLVVGTAANSHLLSGYTNTMGHHHAPSTSAMGLPSSLYDSAGSLAAPRYGLAKLPGAANCANQPSEALVDNHTAVAAASMMADLTGVGSGAATVVSAGVSDEDAMIELAGGGRLRAGVGEGDGMIVGGSGVGAGGPTIGRDAHSAIINLALRDGQQIRLVDPLTMDLSLTFPGEYLKDFQVAEQADPNAVIGSPHVGSQLK